ncbi:MAG: DUF192 domain-containing protein [Bacteroidota bacterium]
MPDIEELDDRNEDVRELLEEVPHSIFIYGNTVFLLIMVALLVLGWVIKYPDILTARVTITTQSPPVRVISNRSGELVDLRVKEGSVVETGEILAIIKSTAEPKDVLSLITILDTIQITDIEKLITAEANWPENLDLGNINGNYADFLSSYHNYWTFANFSPISKMMQSERTKLAELRRYRERLETQNRIFLDEIALVEKDLERNRLLIEKKAITQKEYDDKELELLGVKRRYQQTLLDISDVKIKIVDSERAIADFEVQLEDRTQSLKLALFNAYKRLQASVETWNDGFVLRAPIPGKVSLFDYRAENQFVNQLDEVFTIVPTGERDKIGRVLLPVRNSGKLALGQSAIIKLDDYQFQEFGTLGGTVSEISSVPRGNLYAVEVDIPDDLLTSYGQEIAFRNEMLGSIEIITEDISLLQRILYELIKKLDPQRQTSAASLSDVAEVAFYDESDKQITSITVEVAQTQEERNQGLMYRTELEANRGMLFVQPQEEMSAMWMKNTSLALDILFIDENYRIVNIHQNAKPFSTSPIGSKEPVKYIIEVNAGFCSTYSLQMGQTVNFLF